MRRLRCLRSRSSRCFARSSFFWSSYHGYLGRLVFNHWTVEETRGGSQPRFLPVPCVIEIRVTSASGKPDWLSRRGCAPLLPLSLSLSLRASLKRSPGFAAEEVALHSSLRSLLLARLVRAKVTGMTPSLPMRDFPLDRTFPPMAS